MAEKAKLTKTLVGTVTKISSQETIKVRVETKKMHAKYGKVIKTHKSYLVHNPGIDLHIGDVVRIAASRPISKLKSWTVLAK